MIRIAHFFLLAILIALSMIFLIPLAQASVGQDKIEIISDQVSTQDGSNFTEPLNIVASFYPIFEFVKQVGGDKVTITSLIPVGVEPHDFEPTIQQIQNGEIAHIVFFNGLGFESSWISRINNDNIVDTSSGINITTMTGNTVDPHIWLDPELVKSQVKNIEEALIKLDPANKEYYEKNASNFSRELDSLDSFIRSILQTCDKKDFIAFHDAFSYFANRYGLKQHSIQGASPEGVVLPQ